MKPIEFAQQTLIIAKDQPEYLPLPAHVSLDGIVTSCWEFTDDEIMLLRATKRIWLQQYTFGQALQPQRPSVEIPVELG